MAGSESTPEENPENITPQMFLDVLRGGGTPKERELILKAMDDPHSELHDWLHGVEEWAERTFGRKSASSRAADGMIADAVARQHREDLVAFVQRKRTDGQLSDEECSQILASGAINTHPQQPATSEDYLRTADAMGKLIRHFHPELSAEIDDLLKARGQEGNDRGRP